MKAFLIFVLLMVCASVAFAATSDCPAPQVHRQRTVRYADITEHSHPVDHTHYVLSGQGALHMDGQIIQLSTGVETSVPAGVRHSIVVTESPLVFDDHWGDGRMLLADDSDGCTSSGGTCSGGTCGGGGGAGGDGGGGGDGGAGCGGSCGY